MTTNDIYLSILSGFTASLNAMRLYPEKHPQTQGAFDRCFRAIEQAFSDESELSLLAVDGAVYFNGRPLPGAGLTGEALGALLQRKGIDRLTFSKGLTKEQLAAFMMNLASKDNAAVHAQSHIRLGKIVLKSEAPDAEAAPAGVVSAPCLGAQATAELKSLYGGIQRKRLISGIEVNDFALDFVKKINAAAQPLSYLADIKSEDEYTFVHTVNVAMLTVSFAVRLGFSGKALSDIACAALMHDVGKMFIPGEILNKNGALSPEERSVIELHPVWGALYLGRMGGLPRLSMAVALEHHIKYDGTGYPRMRSDFRPHWVSQMVSIADVFDALRSRRPYRDSLGLKTVTEILRKDIGTALNPALAEQFIDMVEQQSFGP